MDKIILNLLLISFRIPHNKSIIPINIIKNIVVLVILDEKLATDGIQYSYSYLLEGIYQPDQKSQDSGSSRRQTLA